MSTRIVSCLCIGVFLLGSSWSPFGPRPLERATSLSLSTRDHLDDADILSKLATSVPNATRRTCLTHSISRMLGQQVNEKHLIVMRQGKVTDINDGIAGDPIFFAKTEHGQPRYVVKAYRNGQKLACELSAFDLLAHLSLKRARVPSLSAIGRAVAPEGRYLLLAYEYLSGEPVTALLQKAGVAEGWERQSALMVVERAVESIGSALAELHGAKVRVSCEESSYFVKKEERVLTKFLAALERHPDLISTSQEEFVQLFRTLQEKRSEVARLHTYAHLDPHLGNWIYDEQHRSLSMIDLQTLHYSVGEGGKPLGSPWLDYLVVYFNLEGMGKLYGLTRAEVAQLQEVFHQAYDRDSSLPLPSADELVFYSLYYWMKMVGIFANPSANDSPDLSCQKEQMTIWGARGLAECLKDLACDNPYREKEEHRECEASSRKWAVGF